MPVFLLVLFAMFAEFWLLVAIAKQIGVFATLGATLVTAVIGLALVRRQGLETLARAQSKSLQGQSPAKEMVTGLAIFFAGVFLFVPGFISDTVGFALLIPGVRGLLGKRLFAPIIGAGKGQFQFYQRTNGQNRTFEGEYERFDTESSEKDKKNQNILP